MFGYQGEHDDTFKQWHLCRTTTGDMYLVGKFSSKQVTDKITPLSAEQKL